MMQGGFAYIDPATTSYLIQIGVGVVIAVGTTIGIYRSKIKRAFRKKQENAESEQQIRQANDGKDAITAADLLDESDDE